MTRAVDEVDVFLMTLLEHAVGRLSSGSRDVRVLSVWTIDGEARVISFRLSEADSRRLLTSALENVGDDARLLPAWSDVIH